MFRKAGRQIGQPSYFTQCCCRQNYPDDYDEQYSLKGICIGNPVKSGQGSVGDNNYSGDDKSCLIGYLPVICHNHLKDF